MNAVPVELSALLEKDKKAKEFFETLAGSYRRDYCDCVGAAKQEATRRSRAEKAILMLRNGQKTLKVVP